MRQVFLLGIAIVLCAFVCDHRASAQSRTGYWTKFSIPQDSAWPVRLTFADSLVGYLQCSFGEHASSYWYYRTLDGGASWKLMTFGANGKDHQRYGPGYDTMYAFQAGGQYDIRPASHAVAYAKLYEYDTSRVSGERALLVRTSDCGATWNEVRTNIGASDKWDLLQFFGERYGLRFQSMATGGQRIFYTPDGGASFFPLAITNDFVANHAQYYGFLDSAHWLLLDSLQPINPNLGFHRNSTGGLWTWDSLNLHYPSGWRFPRWHTPYILVQHNQQVLQPVPRSSICFLFTGDDQAHSNGPPWGYGRSDTMVTFFVTPDFGSTWIPNYSFLERAKGFEGTSASDIWMTVLPRGVPITYFTMHDTELWRIPTLRRDSQISASWIVHSTDGGSSWDTDKYTLILSETLEYDGRVISSSDRDHVWIAAVLGNRTTIFKYHPFVPSSVSSEPPASGYQPMDLPFWINIFPNPAENRTTVALARNDPMKAVEVYDLLGRKMYVRVERMSESSVSLDVSQLTPGAYSVLLTDYYGKLSKMFIVHR